VFSLLKSTRPSRLGAGRGTDCWTFGLVIAILGPQMSTVGERIRARRLELGLSQRDIQVPGASYAYISRIEDGSRNASIKALIHLAEKLGVTALWLMTGDAKGHCPVCQRGRRR
jgi:hypothetical protein